MFSPKAHSRIQLPSVYLKIEPKSWGKVPPVPPSLPLSNWHGTGGGSIWIILSCPFLLMSLQIRDRSLKRSILVLLGSGLLARSIFIPDQGFAPCIKVTGRLYTVATHVCRPRASALKRALKSVDLELFGFFPVPSNWERSFKLPILRALIADWSI